MSKCYNIILTKRQKPIEVAIFWSSQCWILCMKRTLSCYDLLYVLQACIYCNTCIVSGSQAFMVASFKTNTRFTICKSERHLIVCLNGRLTTGLNENTNEFHTRTDASAFIEGARISSTILRTVASQQHKLTNRAP